mmetsp:Transcript_66724/g.217191  ORF Transcript_66724/g.217191 Transcript_66724/m.217191 type:complete len:255 (+) Transcript_66724:135-899(+)
MRSRASSRKMLSRCSRRMSGCQNRISSTTRTSLPSCHTSCSHESSNTKHRPSFHSRLSSPTRIRQPPPGGIRRPKWQVKCVFEGPQCGRRRVPGVRREKSAVSSFGLSSLCARTASTELSKRRVTGQTRLARSSSSSPKPSSGNSRHVPVLPARSLSWPRTSGQALLQPSPSRTAPPSNASSSALMWAQFSSNCLTHGNNFGSHQGLEVTPVTKWFGRCRRCDQKARQWVIAKSAMWRQPSMSCSMSEANAQAM